MERCETYASHTLAHVYLMQGMHDKGIEFMLSTENDWNVCFIFSSVNICLVTTLVKSKLIAHIHTSIIFLSAKGLTINACFKTQESTAGITGYD